MSVLAWWVIYLLGVILHFAASQANFRGDRIKRYGTDGRDGKQKSEDAAMAVFFSLIPLAWPAVIVGTGGYYYLRHPPKIEEAA